MVKPLWKILLPTMIQKDLMGILLLHISSYKSSCTIQDYVALISSPYKILIYVATDMSAWVQKMNLF